MNAEDDFDLIPGLERTPPVAPVARRTPWWDRLTIYLPVLLMGLLALGSYWLLRVTPVLTEPPPARVGGTDPDYFMRRFSVKSFDAQGVLRAEVAGDEARHHPDDDRVEIDSARLRNLGERGEVTQAQARRVTSNAASTVYVLEGDAIVVREGGRDAAGQALPRLEIRGNYLNVELEPAERVRSSQPVTLWRNLDRMSGDNLDYRGDERVADLRGRVRVTLPTRAAP